MALTEWMIGATEETLTLALPPETQFLSTGEHPSCEPHNLTYIVKKNWQILLTSDLF